MNFLFTAINKYLTINTLFIILYLIINIVYNKEKPMFIAIFNSLYM